MKPLSNIVKFTRIDKKSTHFVNNNLLLLTHTHPQLIQRCRGEVRARVLNDAGSVKTVSGTVTCDLMEGSPD